LYLQLVRPEGESFRQSDCRLLDLAIAVSDDWRQASLQMAPAIRNGDGRRLACNKALPAETEASARRNRGRSKNDVRLIDAGGQCRGRRGDDGAGVGSGNAYDRGVVLASFRFVDPLAGGCRGLRLEPAPVISSIMEIVGCPDYIRRWLHV